MKKVYGFMDSGKGVLDLWYEGVEWRFDELTALASKVGADHPEVAREVYAGRKPRPR